MVHIFSLRVQNRFGVLARISGLFSARGYNIDSLSVAPTEDSNVSRMTIVVGKKEKVEEKVLEQIRKQLERQIDVIKVQDITEIAQQKGRQLLERELLLIRVSATPANRSEILQISEVFGARAVNISKKSIILEVIAESDKIESLVELLRPFGIKELTRSGRIAIIQQD